MSNKRLVAFMIAIFIGLALGLAYGWYLKPPAAKNTSLQSLRSDYQADYVLMVAEKYSVDGDGLTAAALLRDISPDDPAVSIHQALILGEQLHYSDRELQEISALQSALTSSTPAPAEATP
jgi:hypothetical protein